MKNLCKIVSYITGIVLLIWISFTTGLDFSGLPLYEISTAYLICLIICPLITSLYRRKIWSITFGTVSFFIISGGALIVLAACNYLFGINPSIVITAVLGAGFAGIVTEKRTTYINTEVMQGLEQRGTRQKDLRKYAFIKYYLGSFFGITGFVISVISVIALIGNVLLCSKSYTLQNLIALGFIIVLSNVIGYLLYLASGCERKSAEPRKTGLGSAVLFGILILSVALIVSYVFFGRQILPLSDDYGEIAETISVIFIFTGIAVAGGFIIGTPLGLVFGISGGTGRFITAILNGICIIPPFITVSVLISFFGGSTIATFAALGIYNIVYMTKSTAESVFRIKEYRDTRYFLDKRRYFKKVTFPVLISGILKGILYSIRTTIYNIVIIASVTILPHATQGWREEAKISSYIPLCVCVLLLIFNILCYIVREDKQNG